MAIPGTDTQVEVLNELITTCRNGQKGYETAAEGVEDSELKALFQRFSEQRRGFAEDLAALRGEAEADDGGSAAGALHRGWIDIKSAIAGNDVERVLAECERGEEHALENYEEALEKDLPEDISSVVRTQLGEVRTAYERVRTLRSERSEG